MFLLRYLRQSRGNGRPLYVTDTSLQCMSICSSSEERSRAVCVTESPSVRHACLTGMQHSTRVFVVCAKIAGV